MYPEMTDEQVNYVAEGIRNFAAENVSLTAA
jgi:hypothetical protein